MEDSDRPVLTALGDERVATALESLAATLERPGVVEAIAERLRSWADDRHRRRNGRST